MEREVSIQSLLDKIKREGIEEARHESERILKAARTEAGRLIAQAEGRKKEILEEAGEDSKRLRDATEMALSQASRNLVQSIKTQIVQLCRHILKRDVGRALTPEFMKAMIIKLVNECRIVQDDSGLEILLNKKDCEELEHLLHGSLQAEFKKGFVFKPVDKIRAGFHIGEQGGSMHYDFTDQAIAEILSQYLSPRISQYLKDLPEDDLN
jgi:V/A-type H+-transporting ATPase subunit E